eukprot:8832932-Ditylum_brightwellii.AAC.1
MLFVTVFVGFALKYGVDRLNDRPPPQQRIRGRKEKTHQADEVASGSLGISSFILTAFDLPWKEGLITVLMTIFIIRAV